MTALWVVVERHQRLFATRDRRDAERTRQRWEQAAHTRGKVAEVVLFETPSLAHLCLTHGVYVDDVMGVLRAPPDEP